MADKANKGHIPFMQLTIQTYLRKKESLKIVTYASDSKRRIEPI